MAFVNAAAWVSHREDHHPDFEVGYNDHRVRHSFPTRRSSDLDYFDLAAQHGGVLAEAFVRSRKVKFCVLSFSSDWLYPTDRKSTRLNSSHVSTSYAVFCLKKKKNLPVQELLRDHGLRERRRLGLPPRRPPPGL